VWRLTLRNGFCRVAAMQVTAEQMELLAGFPVEKVRRPSLLRELAEVFDRHGPVVPQHMVAKLLGVSRQRVGQLVEAGRIAVVRLAGHQYVPYDALRYFLAEERKNGRPFKVAEAACSSPLVKLAENNS
jgi:excisionase family DNA binding protein